MATPHPATDSYWHNTAPMVVPDDPLPRGSDVVVVGGGMVGCWTAYWLARAGVPVTVIERHAIGWGATGRNGGFVGSGTAVGYLDAIARYGHETARDLWTLTQEGHDLAARVIDEEEIACEQRWPGILSLALSGAEWAEMRADIEALHADGFAGEILDRAAAQEMIDTPLADEIAGAARYAPDGGQVHSLRYLTGVAAAARRHGARFARAGVTALVRDGDGWRVETDAGSVHAGRVVTGLNAWSDELIPALAGKVVPVRGQILAYEPSERVFRTGIGASVTPTGEYWQQTLDGSIVIGGCRADAPGKDVGVRDMVPTPELTAKIEAVIPRLFPALTNLVVARRWAGLMAFTADYLPVAGAVPDMPGVWSAGGFCGSGMPYGPRLGQLLAEAAATGDTPEALDPLRLDRPALTPLAVPA